MAIISKPILEQQVQAEKVKAPDKNQENGQNQKRGQRYFRLPADFFVIQKFGMAEFEFGSHDRARIIFENLRELGVGVNLHYIPVHLQPYYENIGFRKGDFPLSENYYTKAISIPIYPQLEEQKQKHVINSIYKVVSFRSTP